MKRKLILPLLAILLLLPWPIAYGYDNAAADQSPIQIEVAEPTMSPTLKAFRYAIGSVTAGDLFYVDATNNAADILVTLHITNTDELINHYRYLTLKVGIYVETGTEQWEKVTMNNGEPLPDIYITMLNGRTSCTLPGYAKYKITIDRGCFYCYGTTTDASTTSPNFYLTVE